MQKQLKFIILTAILLLKNKLRISSEIQPIILKKIFLLVVFFVLIQGSSWAQDSYRMRKLSSFNNPNLPKVDGTDIWNDLTGYFDPIKKREYIICGGTDSVYVFDITDAKNMVRVSAVGGVSIFARNRDYETYKHYAYCVSDQGSGVGALQIFDLQYLPDSIHLVYQSNELGTFTHTIFIDSVSERMYMSSNLKPSGFSAMDIISLRDPEKPTMMCSLNVPKKPGGFPLFNIVHEMFARHDTVYLSCGDPGLYIFDVRDTANHVLIGSINSYPDQGYNHSSWLDKTGKYLMFTDENMGLDIKIFDIHTLSNPQFISQFNSNANTTSHNAYWVGNFAYVSAYHDGVRVYNIADPSNPKQVAWYDTHPETPEIYGGYKGCWGVYPYLPSHHIIASDLTSGIYVFEIDSELVSVESNPEPSLEVNIFPNPSTGKFKVSSPFNKVSFELRNTIGELILTETNWDSNSEINLSQYPEGVYFITLSLGSNQITKKLMKW